MPFIVRIASVAVAGMAATALVSSASSSAYVIAHRGASAYAPEHTVHAYRLAIEQGADFVEPDLSITKDGVLVVSHDSTLERTTDVEVVFPNRFTAITVDGKPRKVWYVEDFTLDEIKQLDNGRWFGEEFAGSRVLTFQEAIDLVKGRAGLFPELKDPGRLREKGFDLVAAVAEALEKNGLVGATFKGRPAVHLQVFEVETLERLAARLPGVPRSFLMGTPEMAERWLSAEGLKRVATFATAVSPAYQLIGNDPAIVTRAHAQNLTVVPYTFRMRPRLDTHEDVPAEYRRMVETAMKGLPETPEALTAQMKRFVADYKVDGLFTDNPDLFPR